MKKLYFLRHGQSEMNVQKRFAGAIDTPLTKEGKAQAKRAGQTAKKKSLKIDLIVCSPLTRTLETAKIVAREIGYDVDKIEVNPMLIERNFGSLEGQLFTSDVNIDDIIDIETTDKLLGRAKEIHDWLLRIEADNVLIVGHGAFGRAIRHHVLNIPFTELHETEEHMLLPNAEIIEWI